MTVCIAFFHLASVVGVRDQVSLTNTFSVFPFFVFGADRVFGASACKVTDITVDTDALIVFLNFVSAALDCDRRDCGGRFDEGKSDALTGAIHFVADSARASVPRPVSVRETGAALRVQCRLSFVVGRRRR